MIQVCGHKKIIFSLLSSVKNKTLPPFLLFSGPSGVGKKQTAFFISQAVLCIKKQKPCGECDDCQKIENNRHPSVLFIEPKDLNIKLDSLSKIRSFLSLQSFSPHRIILIDQADKMNIPLQNAMLKVLEEPFQNVHFILIADRLYKLLQTVQSRAHRIRFYPLSLEDLKQILPNEKEWALKNCRGQLDRIHQWQDQESLYHSALQFWENLFHGKTISKDFSVQLKDRKKSILVSRFWQELLRDVRFYQEGAKNWIHPQHISLYEKLSTLSPSTIDLFYQKALTLEEDISSYLDCILCFENFWHQAKHQIHNKEKAHV